jgi:hypothetical protein
VALSWSRWVSPSSITRTGSRLCILESMSLGAEPLPDPISPAPPTSLETKSITARWERKTSRRKGRAFHRVRSGLQGRGREYRFLTLTTLAGVRDTPEEFQEDWRKLKERMRRRHIMPPYIRVVEFTKSGLPHAHIILAGGGYLPQWWIANLWEKLHGAIVVDIRSVSKRAGDDPWEGHNHLAGYFAKYMAKQQVARLAMSPGWLWPGLARTWGDWTRIGRILDIPFERTLAIWNRCCENLLPPHRHPSALWVARRNPLTYHMLYMEWVRGLP